MIEHRIVCAKQSDRRHSYHVYTYSKSDRAHDAVEKLNNDEQPTIPVPGKRGCKPWAVETREVSEWTRTP